VWRSLRFGDSGRLCLWLAWLAALVLYLPTLAFGIVGYDDAWLVRDNWVVQTPSWQSLRTIFCELESAGRYTLAPEYLPLRDLSVMLDFVIWGDSFGGFHLTNVLLYLALIGAWFLMLVEFGIERRTAGLALLIFAVHPVHAESVAWLAERKGLLGMTFAGLAGFSYARFRAGSAHTWLVFSAAAGVCAVWSKAHSAFALAALVGLELVWPARRASARRALTGLGIVGVTSLAAFVPVVWLAAGTAIVGDGARAPAARWAMALGSHGFYFRLASATLENAVSYPISTLGPSALELGIGALGIALLLAVAALPARFTRVELRGAALLWLFGWLPVSYVLMPLQMVFVADRYLLIPSMGVALAIAALCARISGPLLRAGVVAIVIGLFAVRSVAARESWSSAERLWARAVESNPSDGAAWSMYAEALAEGGRLDLAAEAVEQGLERARHPRLLLRRALLRLRSGDAVGGRAAMREAATGGEARAMSNLALLLLEDGRTDEALDWARRGAQMMDMYAPAQRALGRVALRAKRSEEALAAFERAFALDPRACTNRFNLALAELELRRVDAARVHVEPCANDAELGAQSKAMLVEIARRQTPRGGH